MLHWFASSLLLSQFGAVYAMTVHGIVVIYIPCFDLGIVYTFGANDLPPTNGSVDKLMMIWDHRTGLQGSLGFTIGNILLANLPSHSVFINSRTAYFQAYLFPLCY